jgi:hypothetical protein
VGQVVNLRRIGNPPAEVGTPLDLPARTQVVCVMLLRTNRRRARQKPLALPNFPLARITTA